MTDHTQTPWFADADSAADRAQAITAGTAITPEQWPAIAVEDGVFSTESAYYEALHAATTTAAAQAVTEHEQATDQQLIHLVRTLDDCTQQANELAERVVEWGNSLLPTPPDAGGTTGAAAIAEHTPESPLEQRLVAVATRCADLEDETTRLRETIEDLAPTAAPNLTALAGPILAARLIALAGSLESLAKMPASTVQVLGAEDALFAHLRGNAPSPKHGVIFTHEYVRETAPSQRGSAARALAGKLTIAARVDHYAGDYRPELADELDDRIEQIRRPADE